MPIAVRVFLWLLVAYLAWNVWGLISVFVFTPPDIAAHLAHISQSTRQLFWSGMYIGLSEPLAVHVLLPLTLALVVVFARQGWARWLLAAYFLSLQVLAPVMVARIELQYPQYSHQTSLWSAIQAYILKRWMSPAPYLWLAFEILLIALIFSPNARPWFRRNAAGTECR